jgi:uncharacterized membrane protein (DUF4010 family)
MTELETTLRLAIAAVCGMAVGLERQWSGHATGPHARFAGVRTFFLLGSLGGLAGWLMQAADPLLSAALLLGASAFVVTAYIIAARRGPEGIDGTTEAAALVVLGIGVLAGMGTIEVASGATAVVVVILHEKSTIHGFLERIGEEELRAALQFAVLALVILPLLPEGPVGPFGGIKPRGLWTVVLIFCGLNFAGYLARRALGDTRGYPAMGALGGLVSSTAVTLSFSRLSRKQPASSWALAIGTVAGSTVVVPRVLVLTLVLNSALAPSVAVGLSPVLLAGAAMLALSFRRHQPRSGGAKEGSEVRNPLQLWSAIQMVVAFQLVISLLTLLTRRFGEAGVLATAAVLGLTDMDALTYGMNRLAQDASLVTTAARAISVGVTVNCLFKTGLALGLGSPEFRRAAVPRLLLLAAAGAVGFLLVGRVTVPV